MNTQIKTSLRRLRNQLELAFIALAFTCSAVSPAALAAPRPTPTPTPSGEDRGNSNSAAENVDALNINTTGLNNTAHGWHSLSTNTGGSDNTGNGFYGAYQFTEQTWSSLGLSGLPSQAAPAVQDDAAKRLQARDGWGSWPACSRKLGLS